MVANRFLLAGMQEMIADRVLLAGIPAMIAEIDINVTRRNNVTKTRVRFASSSDNGYLGAKNSIKLLLRVLPYE